MVVFEVVRAGLDLLGVNGSIAVGIAAVLVGIYYSREFASLLARTAQVVSLAALLLGGVGLLVVVGLGLGWIQIDGGVVGGALRALGGLLH